MSDRDPHIITLSLHPGFVESLRKEYKKAILAQNVFSIIPPALLQLGTIVLSEIEVKCDNDRMQ